MEKVETLYDSLYKMNDGRSKKQGYPIHKSIKFKDGEISNLYELMGISISKVEIDQANKNLESSPNIKNCRFKVKSFDDVSPSSFDLIVAIESLKHSPEFAKSFETISRALKPEGELIIIDDISSNLKNDFIENKLKSDWIIPSLLSEKDYLASTLKMEEKIDFSKQVKLPSLLLVWSRIIFAELAIIFSFFSKPLNQSFKILRGGFYQELLYKKNRMNYCLYKFKQPS